MKENNKTNQQTKQINNNKNKSILLCQNILSLKTFPQVNNCWSDLLKLKGSAHDDPASVQKLIWNPVLSLWSSVLLQCPTPPQSEHLAQAKADTGVLQWGGDAGLGFHRSGWDFNSWQRQAKGTDSCRSYQSSGHCQFLPRWSFHQQITTKLPNFQQVLCPCFPHHLWVSSASQAPLKSPNREKDNEVVFIFSPMVGTEFWYSQISSSSQFSAKNPPRLTAASELVPFQGGIPLKLSESYRSSHG